MKRCTKCLIPDTRPDTPFTEGVCSACLSYSSRPLIDWEDRRRQLVQLLDRHHGECIVPSSGGKDSTAQVIYLQEMGAHVTVVTATTCYLTELGRANIDNLARFATTIEVSPNKEVRAKLNRLGLRLVGDISWPEHVAIFTTPFNIARQIRVPLIFYGENPQNQYGGPPGTDQAKEMTRRWVSEFGGFLGLRVDDMVGKMGITDRDLDDYRTLIGWTMSTKHPEAHFLGQYLPWNSHHNARIACDVGMKYNLPTAANWWPWENLDNAMTGLHDWFMYLKYGYGRGCAQASVDVRAGDIWRDGNLVWRRAALGWMHGHDGLFPIIYAGVPYEAILDRIGMTQPELLEIANQFTTRELFDEPAFTDQTQWPNLTLKEENDEMQ